MRAIYLDVSLPRVVATQAAARLWSGAALSPLSPVKLGVVQPRLPGPRWVRVDNRLCGICGSDMHVALLELDPRIHSAALQQDDRIFLGHEVVGVVAEAAEGVTRLAVGDRVVMQSRFLCPTCHSQEIDPVCRHCAEGNYTLCENRSTGSGPTGVGGGWGDGYCCHESEVWKVPDALTDEQAVLVEPLACGVRAALRRPLEPEAQVLVLGSGTIGLATVQAIRAVAPGARVFAAARHAHQVAAASRLGAVVVSGDLHEAAVEHTGAKLYRGMLGNRTVLGGFDAIYDCVGSAKTVGQALRLCRAGGAVVLVGLHLGPVSIDLTPVPLQEVDLVGVAAHGMEQFEGERLSTFDVTARLLERGQLTTEGFITHRFSLADWRAALRVAADKQSGCIKAVFDYRDEP